MSKKIHEKAKAPVKEIPSSKIDRVFVKQNYMLTGLAFAVVIIGFLLMWGGKEDIYSFRRITLAPIVVITGFLSNIISCDKSWPIRTEVSYIRFENEKNKVYYSCSDVIVEIQKPICMTIPLSGMLMPDQS